MRTFGILLVTFLFVAAGIFAEGKAYYLPHPDGAYDDNNVLVDPAEGGIVRMSRSVVRIITSAVLKANDREFYYADTRSVGGAVIAGRYILSVAHGVAEDKIEIEMPFGTAEEPASKTAEIFMIAGTDDRPSAPLTLLYLDREIDIAIFELPDGYSVGSFPFASGHSRDLRVGNFVYIIGYPLALGINVRAGIVSGLALPDEWETGIGFSDRGDFFLTSVGLIPNDSGTPIVAIRDGRYELVGVASSMANFNNLGAAVRIDTVRNAIANDCPRCPDDLKAFFGIAPRPAQ